MRQRPTIYNIKPTAQSIDSVNITKVIITKEERKKKSLM